MANKVIIYTYVVADLFHVGHLSCLEQSKALGDYLIVGVYTDKLTMTYKREPVIPLWERKAILKRIDLVDKIVIQHEIDPTSNIKALDKIGVRVDILTHGDDWGENFAGAEYMRSIGRKAVTIKYYPYQDTTKIINRILDRYGK